jgi:hypothetical protein
MTKFTIELSTRPIKCLLYRTHILDLDAICVGGPSVLIKVGRLLPTIMACLFISILDGEICKG